jgi:hypothetical protein
MDSGESMQFLRLVWEVRSVDLKFKLVGLLLVAMSLMMSNTALAAITVVKRWVP